MLLDHTQVEAEMLLPQASSAIEHQGALYEKLRKTIQETTE